MPTTPVSNVDTQRARTLSLLRGFFSLRISPRRQAIVRLGSWSPEIQFGHLIYVDGCESLPYENFLRIRDGMVATFTTNNKIAEVLMLATDEELAAEVARRKNP